MNLHDELERHGADAAAGSARSLGSVEVRDALGARVRRGRRVRTAGGAGAVAAVALVAVGVWSVLPGIGGAPVEPAGTIDTTLESRGTTYEVDAAAPVDPEIPIDLRKPNDLQCGTPVEFDEGVTVHDSSVVDDGVRLAALSVSSVMPEAVTEQALRDLDEHERDDFWDNLVAENPTEVDASEDGQHAFESQVVVDGDSTITYTTIPLLLKDGEIVSIGVGQGGTGWESEPSRMWTPNPGACGAEDASREYGDGVYEPVLVSQFWSVSLQEPLATIVVSAGEIEYTGLGEPVSQAPDVDDASVDTAPVDPEDLPELGSSGYLAATSVTEVTGDLSCTGSLAAAEVPEPDYTGEAANPVPVPLPRWIETGRLYGYGDDALIGGYPIPLGTDAAALVDQYGKGPARLVLSSNAGDTWVFDASWSERDDLPHDAAGWFVALSQVWDCGHAGIIEPGDYQARLVFSDVDPGQPGTAVLTPITIVAGVPSIPELGEG